MDPAKEIFSAMPSVHVEKNAGKGPLEYPLAIARAGPVHTTEPASYLIQLFSIPPF